MLGTIKETWKEKSLSIISDGWTDPQRPLINFLDTSEKEPMFLKEYKCKHYISNLFLEVTAEVGRHNVVQIITDSAPVLKSTGSIVEAEYPTIFWSPCVVHTLNLTLKIICAAKYSLHNEFTYNECQLITKCADKASFIRGFIMNHSMRLAIFNEFSPLKLLDVADTRFASITCLKKIETHKKRSSKQGH